MSNYNIEQQIIAYIVKLVAYGGGAAAAAFIVFRFLGTKWIESKFAERLEAYKHAQSKELEDVRFKINAMFHRISKLHDKEFEILPVAWEKLNRAYQAIWRCTVSFRQFPNLDNMASEELEEFLSGASFGESQKNKLRKSTQKNRLYADLMPWVEVNDAHKALLDFHSYMVTNRIFLHADLKRSFDTVDALLWKVWVAHKIGKEAGDHKLQYGQFEQNEAAIKVLVAEIEELVQVRLYPVDPIPGHWVSYRPRYGIFDWSI